LDSNIQKFAEQSAAKVMEAKSADSVCIIIMNPKNGEIMAMVNLPEFNLNDPFTLNTEVADNLDEKTKQDLLNQMWRNRCINDTYEPGSTFKVITATAGLEEGVVTLEDTFSCPGFKIVEDRRIRCHKIAGHGGETFLQGVMNSCNPVFIEVGLRVGVDNIFKYYEQLGILAKTGVDLPGEAATIMHKKENVGLVELATMSFGQSFQITPVQLATTVSSIVNGGTRVTPHFGVSVRTYDGQLIEKFTYPTKENIISDKTSETMRYVLEKVVSEGGGKKAYIPGYRIGGKTATSETLPRSANKYISSFIGFAPAEDPQVLALAVIYNPQGIYYGGTIAAPVVKEIFENILPYLGIEQVYAETEIEEYNIGNITMPNLVGLDKSETDKILKEYELNVEYLNEGERVTDQFPLAGETISKTSNILLYLE
jgi:stage V sporulation protein D (sporulation-specific penicillin-binding protein)